MKKLPLFISGLLVVAAITTACSGDEATRGGEAPRAVTVSPDEALAASVEGLARDVQSGQSQFTWSMNRTGFVMNGDGTFAFQSPDSLHLNADYEGHGSSQIYFKEKNESELLVLGQQVYLKSPAIGEGWIVATPQEFGADWDALQRLLSAKLPLNYGSIIAGKLGPVEDVGFDGLYQRYRISVDAGTVMNALADAYGSQGQVMLANRFSGAVTVDVWLDPVSLAMHKLEATGNLDFMGEPTTLSVSLTSFGHNEAPDLPKAPADATTFAELGQ